jgi:hypothetical protein
MENIILPFLLSDKSLREHFEKSVNGKWDKTTMCDNIKRLVTITNDQVYKHHNQFMDINGPQRKRIINGILKASCYSVLSHISDPYMYKDIEGKETKAIKEGESTIVIDTGKDSTLRENNKEINDTTNEVVSKTINDQIVVTSVNEFFTEYSEDESEDETDNESDDDMYDYNTESDDD